MFKNHNILWFCLTLALSVAGFPAAQAAPIIIDTFADTQFAPPNNQIDAPSAIGGKRTLTSDGQIIGSIGAGVWTTFNSIPPGGIADVTYDAGGAGLGVDLTDGGANNRFELDIVYSGTTGHRLELFIEDSSGVTSSFSAFYQDFFFVIVGFGRGTARIPFAILTGGADLTSIDSIIVRNEIGSFDPGTTILAISEIRAVPIPAAVWLLGSGLIGLVAIRKRLKK